MILGRLLSAVDRADKRLHERYPLVWLLEIAAGLVLAWLILSAMGVI